MTPALSVQPDRRSARFDAVAIGLSAACTVHCLALPLLAAGLPLLAAVEEAEWLHWGFLVLAAPASWLALRSRGTPPLLRFAALAGVAGLLLGALGWPDHDLETPVTVASSLVLATTHIANGIRNHRAAHRDHGKPCEGCPACPPPEG